MNDIVIDRIDTFGLEAPLEEPFGYAQAWVDNRSAVLVRVEASDGTVGWGECWRPVAGNKDIVDNFLADELVGKDPTQVERLYDHLYDVSRATYQSIVPLTSISGLDIALWDLKGRLAGEPISSLLGGRRRDAVRAYATGHYFAHSDVLDDQWAKIVPEAERNAAALGAIKLKTGFSLFGYGPDEDIELVERVRAAVGPDVTVMVDANYAYGRAEARRVGRALEDLDVTWFEEPVNPEDLDGYADLRSLLEVPVAGGECNPPYEYPRFFAANAWDIAQPDVCNIGGITPVRRITAQAREHGVEVVPHVWGTPIALAASLNLIGTLPGDPWLEFDRSPNPLREELSDHAFVPDDDGQVAIPTGPGIGIDLDEDAIDRYTVA